MAPERKSSSSIKKIVAHNAKELENPHFDTKMPPALPVYPEIRKKKERLPNVVHGALYRKKPDAEWRSETGAFVQTLREWTTIATVKVPDRLVYTAPIEVENEESGKHQEERTLEAIDIRPIGPHLTSRRDSGLPAVQKKEEDS
jgi:hypothetical protein